MIITAIFENGKDVVTRNENTISVWQVKGGFAVIEDKTNEIIFTRNAGNPIDSQTWANCDAKDISFGVSSGQMVIENGKVFVK